MLAARGAFWFFMLHYIADQDQDFRKQALRSIRPVEDVAEAPENEEGARGRGGNG
jgi:hypothetical protein